MRRDCHFGVAAFFVLWASVGAWGQASLQPPAPAPEPATQPGQAAVSPSSAELVRLVGQLADDDSMVREEARAALMGLRREDLPALRAAAEAQSPLLPGQVDALREIVVQAYLASEPYEQLGMGGFLGLHWEGDIRFSAGTVITEKMAGFCAARMFRTGDVIVKFIDWPQADCRDVQQFISRIGTMKAGDELHLLVLRRGRLIELSFALDPHPSIAGDAVFQWERDRVDLAEQYWREQFSTFLPAEDRIDSDPAPATQP